jgi:hypothetical protein
MISPAAFGSATSFWVAGMMLTCGLAYGDLALEIVAGNGLTVIIRGEAESDITIEVSEDMERWTPVTTVELQASPASFAFDLSTTSQSSQRFYRARESEPPGFAEVLEVTASGIDGAYTFSVRIRSPDLGCSQYADWWEVLTEQGQLLYRRILTHSHVAEQPFTRSGGPVPVAEDQAVWIRAHMHPFGYGPMLWKGSVASGFASELQDEVFVAGVAAEPPLPAGCAF